MNIEDNRHLGSLHHVRALRADGLTVSGLILVGDEHQENQRDLQAMGEVSLLARVPQMTHLEAEFDACAQALRRNLERV